MNEADYDKIDQRNCALARIAQITRYGTVEGVHFDLRHNESNPDEWVMEPLGATAGAQPKRSWRLPSLWFPWFGIFDPAALENEVKDEFDETNKFVARADIHEFDKLTKLPKSWIKSEVKKRTPEATVLPGDAIVASRIKIVLSDEPFRHQHDIETRLLFVDIVRGDGARKKLANPIVMSGKASIKYRTRKSFFQAVVDRMSRHYKREINLPPPRTVEERRALEEGCTLGYYWAKIEAELSMKPLAIAGLKSREGAKTAGEKSGQSRRIIADTTWKPHALELAKSIRDGNPALSQQDVATEIAMSWKLKIPTPGHSTLKAFIANLEKTGTLPRATKSKRG